MLYTKSITSPLGPLFLASDGTAITGLWLEHQKYFGSTLTGTPEECPNLLVFEEAEAWLAAYFAKAPLPALPPLPPRLRNHNWSSLHCFRFRSLPALPYRLHFPVQQPPRQFPKVPL